MDEQKIAEDVSITPFVRDIERLFVKAARGIKKMLFFVLEGIVEFFQLAFKYFFILALAGIVGGAIGFFSTKIVPQNYSSSLVLQLNVDARDQLTNDVLFFNALIKREDHEQLASILNLSIDQAASLQSFEIYSHADFIEKTLALQDLYSSIDTNLFNSLDLIQQASENEEAFSSRFKIIISASQQDVFKTMESPLLAYFERVPELKTLLVATNEALHFQRNVYVNEMQKIDTLLKVMNQVMLVQAAQPSSSGDMTVNMGNEKALNDEHSSIKLHDRSIFYAQRISKIDLDIQKHQSPYFVISHLNTLGDKTGAGALTRTIYGSLICFALVYLLVGYRNSSKKTA